jgi:hypothetical protein
MSSTLYGGKIFLNTQGTITLQKTNTVALIFTNSLSVTCQQEDPLNPTVSPQKELLDLTTYVFTDIKNNDIL